MTAGVEYMPKAESWWSVELRTSYSFCSYRWGDSESFSMTKVLFPQEQPKNATEFQAFLGKVGVVPKAYFYNDDPVYLFMESELAWCLLAGRCDYLDTNYQHRRNFTDTFFSCSGGVGIEYRQTKVSYALSAGLSSLAFEGSLKDHRPEGFTRGIGRLYAPVYINATVKLKL